MNYLFAGLTATQVVLIAGNHDYIKKDSYYRTFKWADNVHMLADKELSYVELPELSLAVYGFSYHQREITGDVYSYALPEGRQKYEILLAHGGDENHIPIRKEVTGTLGYDYVALGHIHKPAVILADRMAYAGALEPVDKNDTGPHGYIRGELCRGGCRIEFVPCAQREYIHMEIEVTRDMTGYMLRDVIAKHIQGAGIHNIYKIILTGLRDPDVIFDTDNMDQYGNIIEITDATKPAYNFERLMEQNRDNLLGIFIQGFKDCKKDSVEYMALCEGVQALMETRRGQA